MTLTLSMRRTILRVHVVVLTLFSFALTLCFTPARGAAARATPTPDFAAIDAFVESERQALRIPGLALGIVQGDRIVHLKGFGSADPSGRAVTPQTPFLIGSNAKSMTAMAIMQLVEAGTIDLDLPVQRYLPWFRVADAGASGRITVRQLLTHTSGLPTMAGAEHFLDGAAYPGVLIDRVRALHTLRLNRAPGERYEYANMNYVVLAVVIEAVSGQPFARSIEQHIFAPLGMARSYLSQTQARANGAARGYQHIFGQPVPSDQPFIHGALGAGWIYASAEDMARYLSAYLNAGRIGEIEVLSLEGIETLLRPAVEQGGERFYGLGWDVWSDAGVRIVGHNGGTSDFTALQRLIPEQRLGFVILMNTWSMPQITRVTAIGEGVTSLLLGREPAPPAPDPLPFILYGVPMGVISLQLLATVLAARTLRRVRHDPGRPHGRRQLVALLGGLMVCHVAWGALPLLVLPRLIGFPVPLLRVYIPDVGWLILASAALGLVHGVICGMLALRTAQPWYTPRATPAPA